MWWAYSKWNRHLVVSAENWREAERVALYCFNNIRPPGFRRCSVLDWGPLPIPAPDLKVLSETHQVDEVYDNVYWWKK